MPAPRQFELKASLSATASTRSLSPPLPFRRLSTIWLIAFSSEVSTERPVPYAKSFSVKQRAKSAWWFSSRTLLKSTIDWNASPPGSWPDVSMSGP